jgi:hypothetical protein
MEPTPAELKYANGRASISQAAVWLSMALGLSGSPAGAPKPIRRSKPPPHRSNDYGWLSGIPNLHEYEDEKVEALEAWAQRLKSIVSPVPVPAAPAKVVKLRGRRR